MTSVLDKWIEGFVEKAAELDVDPVLLVKSAQDGFTSQADDVMKRWQRSGASGSGQRAGTEAQSRRSGASGSGQRAGTEAQSRRLASQFGLHRSAVTIPTYKDRMAQVKRTSGSWGRGQSLAQATGGRLTGRSRAAGAFQPQAFGSGQSFQRQPHNQPRSSGVTGSALRRMGIRPNQLA